MQAVNTDKTNVGHREPANQPTCQQKRCGSNTLTLLSDEGQMNVANHWVRSTVETYAEYDLTHYVCLFGMDMHEATSEIELG